MGFVPYKAGGNTFKVSTTSAGKAPQPVLACTSCVAFSFEPAMVAFLQQGPGSAVGISSTLVSPVLPA